MSGEVLSGRSARPGNRRRAPKQPGRLTRRRDDETLSPEWRARLLDWYRAHHRDLPWRRTRDPYAVWVSEVMLQQTRVAAATPFYQRFLERFPTLASLARARWPSVLAAWAGLGYYRRARHLHEAARLVMRDHAGRVPDQPDTFGKLPGAGRYTTGAVLSLCFDRPLPVLDGNVARVLSRVFALPASVKDTRGAKALWGLAESLVPMRAPGEWNQALMELGARVCLPRGPCCEVCPLQGCCRSEAEGRIAEFPPVPRRRREERVRRVVARIEHQGRMLVVQRRGALLDGLWEPPGVDLTDGENPGAALAAELRRLGLRARLRATAHTIRHVITHRAIEARVWSGVMTSPGRRGALIRWVDPQRPRVALTALARKVGALDAS